MMRGGEQFQSARLHPLVQRPIARGTRLCLQVAPAHRHRQYGMRNSKIAAQPGNHVRLTRALRTKAMIALIAVPYWAVVGIGFRPAMAKQRWGERGVGKEGVGKGR